MYKKICNATIEQLCNADIIGENEKELYKFGLEGLLFTSLNLGTALIIGIVMDAILECVVFLMAFLPLRQYAGGYHAKTRVGCYLLSVTCIWVAMSILVHQEFKKYMLVMACAMVIVIFLLSPVENENRELTCDEKMRYGRIAKVILLLEMSLILLNSLIGIFQVDICVSIECAIINVGIMLLLGKTKKQRVDLNS